MFSWIVELISSSTLESAKLSLARETDASPRQVFTQGVTAANQHGNMMTVSVVPVEISPMTQQFPSWRACLTTSTALSTLKARISCAKILCAHQVACFQKFF